MLNNSQNQPGIVCPNTQCGGKIRISLQDLLYQNLITCPYCLLQLTLDREKSREIINAAANSEAVFKNGEESKKFK